MPRHPPAGNPGNRVAQSGTWISDLLPYTQTVANHLAVIKSVSYRSHQPRSRGHPFMNTRKSTPRVMSQHEGHQVGYGLGSENANLPAFIAMTSQGSGKNPGQPIFFPLVGRISALVASSRTPAGANPVLYLADPPGTSRAPNAGTCSTIWRLNQGDADDWGDPETLTRIQAYREMAFPHADVGPGTNRYNAGNRSNPGWLPGPDVRRPGSYAANCLLARRLTEQGVRFVRLYHRGWDQHIALARQYRTSAGISTSRPPLLSGGSQQRGLLQGDPGAVGDRFGHKLRKGEFGDPGAGRDHHGRCFTCWMAGGGIQGGLEYGSTDDFCFTTASPKTPCIFPRSALALMHCTGIDHPLQLPFPRLACPAD
ncbi:MAG: DUF1501 domain-containing protein [Planctomycetaceae bacterium]